MSSPAATPLSAPPFSAPQKTAERLPSSDAAEGGADIIAASPLIAVIEDAIETLEAMGLHTDNPLYDRLVAAVTRPDRGAK